MELKKELKFSELVSWGVFLITLIVVIFSIIAAVFPNLLLSSFGGVEDHLGINPFETGIWAFPLLITNFIVLGLVILYLKQRLPNFFTSSIKFIFNFEVSSKIAFLVIVILIGMYIVFSVGELIDGKFQPDYYERVSSWLEEFSFTKLDTDGFNAPGILGYFHTMLGYISIQVFGNVKVIPLLTSIALLVLTYFITYEITKKRFAGIVAIVIILQSGVFLHYDISIAYPNFWILFYLFSLYLIYKKWPLSPIPYIASIFTKVLTAVFLPMTIFFVYRSSISRQKKIRIFSLYGVILICGILFLHFTDLSLIPTTLQFDTHDFWGGFNAIHASLRFDPLVLLFILPLIVGLFFISRGGLKEADSISFLILGMLVSAILVPAIQGAINVPYRFVPLIVFFAMGVGVLLSKKTIE